MTRGKRIESMLNQEFTPEQLEVLDESGQHAGHAGARPEGQTHYRIRMQAASLKGLTRVAAHQKIYAALSEEFKDGLHALAIELS